MYEPHPNSELNALFRHRPFQGATPERAQLLFIGLDANYDPGLELTSVFGSILEYHRDGVAFWRIHGVHHPFLLPTYRGDGRRYHINFAKIGFTSEDAERISFLELLHVPTVGRSKLEVRDLHQDHLDWINSLVTAGEPRYLFVSPGVVRLMAATKKFAWLARYQASAEILPALYSRVDTRVFLHLHFSNYGKFQERMEREAVAISRIARVETPGCRSGAEQ